MIAAPLLAILMSPLFEPLCPPFGTGLTLSAGALKVIASALGLM